jgi:hypothetical protein
MIPAPLLLIPLALLLVKQPSIDTTIDDTASDLRIRWRVVISGHIPPISNMTSDTTPRYYSTDENTLVVELPFCHGFWREVADPLPPGNFGEVFHAEVRKSAKDALVVIVSSFEQTAFQWLKAGQHKNWECVLVQAAPLS